VSVAATYLVIGIRSAPLGAPLPRTAVRPDGLIRKAYPVRSRGRVQSGYPGCPGAPHQPAQLAVRPAAKLLSAARLEPGPVAVALVAPGAGELGLGYQNAANASGASSAIASAPPAASAPLAAGCVADYVEQGAQYAGDLRSDSRRHQLENAKPAVAADRGAVVKITELGRLLERKTGSIWNCIERAPSRPRWFGWPATCVPGPSRRPTRSLPPPAASASCRNRVGHIGNQLLPARLGTRTAQQMWSDGEAEAKFDIRVNCYLYGKRLRAGSRWGVCEQTPECRREHRRSQAR
jgi:hypothetical protein